MLQCMRRLVFALLKSFSACMCSPNLRCFIIVRIAVSTQACLAGLRLVCVCVDVSYSEDCVLMQAFALRIAFLLPACTTS